VCSSDLLSDLPKSTRFYLIYLRESRQLLEALRGANRDLETVLEEMVR
jgi:hypothetical protein